MIAFDANILVRIVTQDDPRQAAKIDALIAPLRQKRESILVCDVVLCELAWVLKDCYDQAPGQVADVLDRILKIPDFVFEDKQRLWEALADYRVGKAGFADCVIGRAGKSAGAVRTYTFDRGLKANSLFAVIA